jgi:hypothetical protein
MIIASLKRLTLIIFILTSALFAKGQQVHFIYLQTENGQPFYVKLDKKIVSSSLAGYLILPKLADGDYKLSIGFPKKEFPEENFQILVDKKNEGYLLKNFGEKGWGLFNMQSFAVVMGGGTNAPDTVSKNLQSDPFSKMLANVVKDSSILQKNEPVKEVASTPHAKDSVTAVQPGSTSFSSVKKLLSNKNKDGMEMIYTDSINNGNDTIRILMDEEKAIVKTDTIDNVIAPTEKSVQQVLKDTGLNKETVSVKDSVLMKNNISIKDTALTNELKESSKANSDTTASTHPLVSENKSLQENKDSVVAKNDEIKQKDEVIKRPEIIKGDSTLQGEKKPSPEKDETIVSPQVVKSSTVNSDCKSFADNEDFFKLRKKMASESSDENMIKIAKKAFHSKCFSTEQIKNISFLFLTNEGKYRFFDEAYAFASDSDQYYTLQSQLTDIYYINRFKAMIHK